MSLTRSGLFFALAALLVVLAVTMTPSTSSAQTADLQALINSLLAQVQSLQTQLGAPSVSQHTSPIPVQTVCNFYRDLSLGAKGSDVTCLQQLLARDPSVYPEASVTGYFGSLTHAAVQRYQLKFALPVNGVVDFRTRQDLSTRYGGGQITPQLTPLYQQYSVSFTATPNTIAGGQSAQLSWSTQGMQSCSVSGPNFSRSGTSGNGTTGSLFTSSTYIVNCVRPDGGQESRTVTVSVTPAPSLNLQATPSSVASGQSVVITWNSQNMSSCFVSGQNFAFGGTSGNQSTGALTSASTYTLTCQRATGGSETRSITVSIDTPTNLTLTASPSSIYIDGTTTVSWSAINVSSCTVTGPNSFSQTGLSGSRTTGSLTADSTYTLTCTKISGGTETKSVTVDVGPVPTSLTLTASPTLVAYNAPATLTWSATGASSCTLTGTNLSLTGLSGSASTGQLSADTTYTLTCVKNEGGTETKAITVDVADLVGLTITANPATVAVGERTTITWSATNTTSCRVTGDGILSEGPVSGSAQSAVLSGSYMTFKLDCAAQDGTRYDKSLTVGSGGDDVTPFPALPIQVGDRVKTTSVLNVRASASLGGTLRGTQKRDAVGTVEDGPTTAGGYTWWKVDWDSGPDGWSVASFIVKASGSGGGSLTATPRSGKAPLTVSFSGSVAAGYFGGVQIFYGDGSSNTFCNPSSACSNTMSHTYATTGTFVARLVGQGEGNSVELGTATITVGDTASSCTAPTRDLSLGDSDAETGGEVSVLQRFLARDSAIYPEGTVSGFYGRLTESAVRRFQAERGVLQTGFVGPLTREAMRAVCSGNTDNPTPYSFRASPVSGAAPLAVTFTAKAADTNETGVWYVVDFGDGKRENMNASATNGTLSISHTYESGGTYAARLLQSEDLCGLGQNTYLYGCTRELSVDSASISVSGGSSSDMCLNIEGVQTSVPGGMTRDTSGNCVSDSASSFPNVHVDKPAACHQVATQEDYGYSYRQECTANAVDSQNRCSLEASRFSIQNGQSVTLKWVTVGSLQGSSEWKFFGMYSQENYGLANGVVRNEQKAGASGTVTLTPQATTRYFLTTGSSPFGSWQSYYPSGYPATYYGCTVLVSVI